MDLVREGTNRQRTWLRQKLLERRPYQKSLPSIIMATVRALCYEMDELTALGLILHIGDCVQC